MADATFTEIVHEACALFRLAPVVEIVPAVAATAPAPLRAVVAMPLGVATTRPEGSVSVK